MRFKISVIVLGIFVSLSLAGRVLALDFTPPPFKDESFSGKYASQSVPDPVTIPAGGTKEITIKIKNTGSSIWRAGGANFVSAYTVDPNYHKSVFYHSGWIGAGQPAKITKDTKPGGIASLTIKLKAPDKAGDYTEKFFLAAENKTWITGTYFYLKIRVTKAAPVPTAGGEIPLKPVADEDPDATGYKTAVVIRSAQEVSAAGGDKIHFIIRFLNLGTASWQKYGLKESGSRPASPNLQRGEQAGEVVVAVAREVSLADNSWMNNREILNKTETVDPKKPAQVEFDFRAPGTAGSYVAKFQLTADGRDVSGGEIELPVTVTADAPEGYVEPVFGTVLPPRALVAEPQLEIGLYKAVEPVKFQSPYNYKVYSGDEFKGILPAGEMAVLSYENGFYTFASQSLQFYGTLHIRLVPDDPSYYFTILNYKRVVSWKGGGTNFNAYRGGLNYEYSPKSDAVFVVNEIPMDLYIAGIGETSNGAHIEYIKAILVAARSYAYYHLNNGLSEDKRTFDVYATTADQIYLGYNSEILMPRVAEAARNTRGEMVTYRGTPVVTPYFGHSDGKTRAWSQVWGGTDKPWLVSVKCKYDVGRTMFGHGVGMSALDASGRAEHDGESYKELLKYYYTDTEVERIY